MSNLASRRARRNRPGSNQLDMFLRMKRESEFDDHERWVSVPLPGWDGYEVSDLGRVRSWLVRGHSKGRSLVPRIRKPGKVGKGYLSIIPGRRKKGEYVHRLVLFAFVGPCPEDQECRHVDGDRTNNRLSNLKWGTPAENGDDKILHGTMNPYVEPTRDAIFECSDNFIPIEAIVPVEIWTGIQGWRKYQISSWGRLRRVLVSKPKGSGPRYAMHSPGACESGHLKVTLYDNGLRKRTSVHRLVIEAFSPQASDALECRHLNGDPSDNRIANLRWGTHLENMRDMSLHETSNRGERCPNVRLTEPLVLEIRRRLAAGERGSRLARELGVAHQTICGVAKRRTWKHLP